MHFSIPETQDLTDKTGSSYSVSMPLNGDTSIRGNALLDMQSIALINDEQLFDYP